MNANGQVYRVRAYFMSSFAFAVIMVTRYDHLGLHDWRVLASVNGVKRRADASSEWCIR